MRPEPSEYADYFARYVDQVEGTDIVDILQEQLESTMLLLKGIDETRGNFRYEPGKWSVKELLGHTIDTERVFAYRVLVFARNDSAALPGFDQDKWAAHANYANMRMSDIIADFEAVRRSTLSLVRHLDEAAWRRRGIGNNREMTTLAAAFVIVGHTQHHLEILKSRYL